MSEAKNIAILGDGAWGTAVGIVLAANGHRPVLWSYDPAYLAEMRETRRNSKYLPSAALPESMTFEPDIRAALARAEVVVSALPSKFLRPVLSGAGALPDAEAPVVSLTKGFDADRLERPSEVIRECLGARHIIALSGPSHAEEVAAGLPASVVVASEELEWARRMQRVVSTPRFRAYAGGDIVGVEVAGAVKNVIALAAGILHAMKLGDNALSALATRGLAEMKRLGVAMGGDEATFAGLAGMGDLITTCVSPHSRNRRVGELLAGGATLDDILANMNGVPESVTTTGLCLKLAAGFGISMPIAAQVGEILWNKKDLRRALDDLMNRTQKDED